MFSLPRQLDAQVNFEQLRPLFFELKVLKKLAKILKL